MKKLCMILFTFVSLSSFAQIVIPPPIPSDYCGLDELKELKEEGLVLCEKMKVTKEVEYGVQCDLLTNSAYKCVYDCGEKFNLKYKLAPNCLYNSTRIYKTIIYWK